MFAQPEKVMTASQKNSKHKENNIMLCIKGGVDLDTVVLSMFHQITEVIRKKLFNI